jgi:hypothetical protein
MKKLILLFFVFISVTGLSQKKYTIKVNTSKSIKEVLTDLSEDLDPYNRFILDSETFTFSSNQNLSEEFFFTQSNDETTIVSVIMESAKKVYQEKGGGTDCETAQLLCDNQSFLANSNGYGTQELYGGNNGGGNRGCLKGNERQSSWYYVHIESGGNLEMTIDPNVNSDDYDFAIWGPFTDVTANDNCSPVTNPIRCSWSLYSGNTGMSSSSTDNSENQYGDKWVNDLNTSAGDVYILLIDNYSISNYGYELSWGGTAILGCTPVVLPVELTSFEGYNNGPNVLTWETASERDNDFFTIEQSIDGKDWKNIAKVNGAGTTSEVTNYTHNVYNIEQTINYYRLSQTDFNGVTTTYKTISIDNSLSQKEIVKVINLYGQEVNADYSELRIVIYSDGTTQKMMGK